MAGPTPSYSSDNIAMSNFMNTVATDISSQPANTMESPPTSPLDEEVHVAYLGPESSYTHQAALNTFKEPWFHLRPVTTIEDVFAKVASGEVSRGVVPFENSSNGSVVMTLDLFANPSGKYSDIVVTNEAYVRVRHCIVGFPREPGLAERAMQDLSLNPSATTSATRACTLKAIKKLYSHPQAWGQCKHYLSTHLKTAEKQDVSSTSRGAEIVAASGDKTAAAISSALAARDNGLAILAPDIQDAQDNCTRFLIIRRASAYTSLHQRTFVEPRVEWESYKTMISFTVSQTRPGALADCLGVFKKHGINLTNFNSRPSGAGAWNYIFFVEFRGFKRAEAHRGDVNVALGEIGGVAESWRWLGSWEDMAGEAK